MNYFWNERKHVSYEDLLNAICDIIYYKEEIYEESYSLGYCKTRYPRITVVGCEYKLKPYYDITSFFKKFRHNENDGDWSKEYTRAIYKREISYNDDGRMVSKSVIDYYITIPPIFEQKPWIVVDSFDRIINSKDLKIDALKHKYDPHWKSKYRKPRNFNWVPGSKWKRGRWQKYLGDHAGSVPDYRNDVHHNIDKKEIYDEYGITFKVRSKRTTGLRYSTNWDGGKNGWIEKGWKQTRKKKQWM